MTDVNVNLNGSYVDKHSVEFFVVMLEGGGS